MPSCQNAALSFEAGQTVYAMSELTNSGDSKTYTSSADYFSGVSGYAPNVKPNGLATGGAITPAAALGNDTVDVAALTCYLAGEKTTVSAAVDKTITRGATTNTHIINSITINSSGVVTVVAGTATTAFSDTRGAAGGPPFIPVGSIEIGQVKLTSITAAPITESEIVTIVGVTVERFDYPIWNEYNETGKITFASALPLIHTGSTPKKVYASYAEPVFTILENVDAFVAPEMSYSTSSKSVYNGVVGSSSKSLGQGSFDVMLRNGVTDPILNLAGKNLWFKFQPDRLLDEYVLCQGVLGVTRSFPSSDNMSAKCTISPFQAAINVS